MNNESEKIVKNLIKTIRHKLVDLDLNNTDLCRIAGVSKSHWSYIMNGKAAPTLETLIKLARAVGLDIDIRFKEHEQRT